MNLDQLQPTQLVHASLRKPVSKFIPILIVAGQCGKSSEVNGWGNWLVVDLEKVSMLNDIIGFNYIITALKVWGWKVTIIFRSEIPQMKPGCLSQSFFEFLSLFFQREVGVGWPWPWPFLDDYPGWGSAGTAHSIIGTFVKKLQRASVKTSLWSEVNEQWELNCQQLNLIGQGNYVIASGVCTCTGIFLLEKT